MQRSVKGVIVCKENVACEPVWCDSPNLFLFLSEDSGNFTQIMVPPASEVKNYSLHSVSLCGWEFNGYQWTFYAIGCKQNSHDPST